MDLEKKVAFIIRTFDLEVPKYIESDFEYDNEVEFWLDRFLTETTNYKGLILAYIDSAYSAALRLANKQ